MIQDGKTLELTSAHGGVGAEGGIVSDARDEARFLAALLNGELLKPRELRALKTPSPVAPYALGLGVGVSGCGGIVYGHSGGGSAFKTNVWVSEDGERVAVLLLNGRRATADSEAQAAMEKLYCLAGDPER